MLFNSVEYLFFLPVVTLIYYLIHHKFRWLLLLIASYFFYMYWRPAYAILLGISTVVDYLAGWALDRSDNKARRKFVLVGSLSINLGLLFFFKYYGFFNQTIHDFLGIANINYQLPAFDILLPIGISFYTFQTISYTVDVYWRKRKAEKHFGIFALYVSFFPQLVAGPIERSTRLLPQLHSNIKFDLSRIIEGGKLIIWGLFKKLIIADTLGVYVTLVFGSVDEHSGIIMALIPLAFGFQLYLDFSAYTDIAIGSARLFGIDLMNNFLRPFRATTIMEFWRRWHISLTTWMFDYVFKPFSKFNRLNWRVNILIVFLVIGIWHGAGWGFIVFGTIHGLFYVISSDLIDLREKFISKNSIIRTRGFKIAFGFLSVLVINMVSVTFFRASSISDAWQIISEGCSAIFHGGWHIDMSLFHPLDLFILCISFPLFLFVQNLNVYDPVHPFRGIKSIAIRWTIYYFVIFSLIIFGTRMNEAFIYFQF